MTPDKTSQEQPIVSSEEDRKGEPTPKIFRAPNGLQIFHHAAAETKYVYREIFEERVYFRHGINLFPGETVFDVGANIGLFTMFVEENFENISVHAFEPSAAIFHLLQANVAKYGDRVSAHACGMADRCGKAKLTFYPGYSIMSGFHSESEGDQTALRAGIKSHLREQGIENPQERFVGMMLKQALHEKQEQECRLETVSGMMGKAEIGALGLLKIDAEGSEWEILKGIREEHWPVIRQIVMEVHDATDAKCSEIRKLLTNKGYQLNFEQEQRLFGAGIVNCYALRG